MRINEIINEMHHVLQVGKEPDAPFDKSDTITVYHGFRDIDDAILIGKYGTSGAKRVSRVYSYENDNNPRGLFVTPYLKIAERFGNIIFEFDARFIELEPPVWPGGSFTVQGGLSQYWGHGRAGRANRSTAQQNLRKTYREKSTEEFIKNSDDPLLAMTLTGMGESQALFIGHLNSNRIKRVHLRDIDRKTRSYTSDWYSISLGEFLEKFPSDKYEKTEKFMDAESKIFQPDEQFDGNEFLIRLSKEFGYGNIETSLGNIWKIEILHSKKNAIQNFKSTFDIWLWPKQMPDAFNWLKKKYKNIDKLD